MNFLGVPLGYAIYYIYKLIPNYAAAIIIFTIILRVVLVPLAIKQQKAMAKTSAFQPYIDEINKKYAKNFAKKNEELQKLYRDHNINPASGCLPMFLPLIVLFGMMDVIYRPLNHILRLSPEVIDSAMNIFRQTAQNVSTSGRANLSMQLNLISDVINSPSKYSKLGSDVVESIKTIDLNFFGFNIGEVSKVSSITIIFPILALVFSFLQILVSHKTNSMPNTNTGGPSFKIVMFTMPLFSVWICLTVPIGVSIYWIVGYILQIIQILILNKVCNVNELKQQMVAEIESKRKKGKKQKKETKTAEVNLDDNERLNRAREILSERYDD